MIRFPDGIHGEMFYQKNRPEWAPEWLEFETLGKRKRKITSSQPKPHRLCGFAPTWLSLELHQLHRPTSQLRFSRLHGILTLDPPEGYPFSRVVEIAFQLKEFIETFGYTPFAKTTGGKWAFTSVAPSSRSILFMMSSKPLKLSHNHSSTSIRRQSPLQIKKEARKGRVLVDIYRIRIQDKALYHPTVYGDRARCSRIDAIEVGRDQKPKRSDGAQHLERPSTK